MKKMGLKLLSVLFATLLLLAAVWYPKPAYAIPRPDEPPIRQLSWQPIQLLYFDAETGEYVEVNPIEPDFDEPPQRYLYSMEAGTQYLVKFDLPELFQSGDTEITACHVSQISYGELGAIIIKATQTIDGIEHYCTGELRFIASGDLQLSHTPPQVEKGDEVNFDDGQTFAFLLQDCEGIREANSQYSYQENDVSITATLNSTPDYAQDLYTTDLSTYLYPDAA